MQILQILNDSEGQLDHLQNATTLRLGQNLPSVKKLYKFMHNLLREAAHRQTQWETNQSLRLGN